MQKDIYVEIGAVEQLNKNIYWSVIIYKKKSIKKSPPNIFQSWNDMDTRGEDNVFWVG